MTKEEILESKSMIEVVRDCGLEPNRSGFIRCPFHEGDNHASLKLYPKSFYCFGCGKGGDVFTFIQLFEHCDFHTAFLRLGGTDRKGRPSRADITRSYRARTAREEREKENEKLKQEILDIGKEIDRCREAMKDSKPLSEEWGDAFNKYQAAIQKQEQLMEKKRGRG